MRKIPFPPFCLVGRYPGPLIVIFIINVFLLFLMVALSSITGDKDEKSRILARNWR